MYWQSLVGLMLPSGVLLCEHDLCVAQHVDHRETQWLWCAGTWAYHHLYACYGDVARSSSTRPSVILHTFSVIGKPKKFLPPFGAPAQVVCAEPGEIPHQRRSVVARIWILGVWMLGYGY